MKLVDASEWETIRPITKALFGGPSRVLLAAWVLTRAEDAFFQQQATDGLRPYGEAPTAARNDLATLVGHGMLEQFRDQNRLYYAPRESAYWPAYEAIAAAVGLLEVIAAKDHR